MIAVDYWIHGKRLEKAIMNKADIVVANSEYLAAYARTVNPNSSFVGQGCDLELYHPKNVSPLPEEVTRLKNEFKLIIGYIGALNNARIDIELLEFLASKKPEWAIVLVGPEDPRFQKSSLHKQKNVIFLGLKKEKELPGYIGFFDIAINPQKVNEITVGNYPRKIDEYLAMGKPIVATRTEAMDFFTGQVYLARNYEDYITLIELAATENDDLRSESRMKYARQHSWENNIEEIGRKIQDLKNIKQDGSTN
jgi:glycosyltransferase involved in cell wall biosynthesis